MATKAKKTTKLTEKSEKKPRGKPFEKGNKANLSGRPKGSKNYKTLAFEERLEALECDPIKVLADVCNDESEETNLRIAAAKELAAYIFPKRKAVEISGSFGKGDAKEMSDEELLNIASGGEG